MRGNTLTNSFLNGLEEVERHLSVYSFKQLSIDEKGNAYFARFQKGTITVEFIFGPSDWDVEMIIFTPKGKFAFKDLFEIPAIAKWVNENKYVKVYERDIKNELLWFVELLKISLSLIE